MAVDVGSTNTEALPSLAAPQPSSINAVPARPFTGIWSVLIPHHVCPSARAGHFTALDDSNHVAYIGYGTSPSGAALTDLWVLDLRVLEWRQITLQDSPMPPRNGSRAVVVGGRLLVFGGFFAGEYIAGLYIIDPATGTCAPFATSGEIPSPRSTPIMAISDNGRLFVWGGYNNHWPSEIHILDLRTGVWTMVPSVERGRTAVPAVVVDNRILSYGGSNHSGIWVLDMVTNVISIIDATGAPPPPDVMKAGMVRVGRHLFFVGGRVKTEPDWTLLYCLDIERMWWFVFFVAPDGESVTMADGLVRNGCFLLPRIHSFGLAYSHEKRAIVAFLGCPYTDPPSLFLVSIGDAMAVINLRDDLRAMLSF
jgi:hypothetical protein